MSNYQNAGPDPSGGIDEPEGPDRYLQPGEELLICTPDVQIKKFRFDAYLTDRRLFLIDQFEKKPGVTAKEIPIQSIADTFIEHSSTQEPVLVLSIRTSDDDFRTMKMTFVHTGEDRTSQAEEWMHLVRHGSLKEGVTGAGMGAEAPGSGAPQTAPEVRSLSETIIIPREPPAPSVPSETVTVSPKPPERGRDTIMEGPSPPAGSAAVTQIQFCYHCGHRIPPNANFCPYCGTRMNHVPATVKSQAPPPLQTRQEEPEPAQKKEKKKKKWGFFSRKK